MGLPFEPQESTHGMKVWNFHTENLERIGGGEVIRETLVWDLAGQQDYQVVHQLFLDETALGIVVFDPTHPEDPFRGVSYWEKALQRVAGATCPRLLVAGRVDRGYPTATERDIELFRSEHGFSEFIATSANTGRGVEELRAAIARTIPWDRLPVSSSPELWNDIRAYLLDRRAGVDVVTRRTDLRDAFSHTSLVEEFTNSEFDTVIRHAQAQGLVWQLSFGDFVVLKPEVLNDYASAVVRVARRHPSGLGAVLERGVLEAQLDFEDLERIPDAGTERSLLHGAVELFLSREVALREGEYLVFPSKFNRELPNVPVPPLREVAYGFAGPVEDIYATLVVRLYHSGAFVIKDLWKDAAEFRDPVGRDCGFHLSDPEEGKGVISVFFDSGASMDSKLMFLRFVHDHLQARSLPSSVTRERIYRCPECGEEVENKRAVANRLQKGLSTIICQYCEHKVPLLDFLEERFGDPELLSLVRELEEEATGKIEQDVAMTAAKAKQDIGEFDVFLAHNSEDKRTVEAIGHNLKLRGLNPWLDDEQIPPGRWFQDVIQQAISNVKAAAIFISASGLGRWQVVELRAFIEECVEREIPVIPVLLAGVDKVPQNLRFLNQFTWVSFEDQIDDREALDRLQWGITGKRPETAAR